MADGVLLGHQSQLGAGAGHSDNDSGSAGIFLERSGNRKMLMSGGRLVLPKLFPFQQQKNRPLEAEEGDILRRNGAQERDSPVSAAYVSPNGKPQQRSDNPSQHHVTCCQCGTSQEWLQDGPFFCRFCQIQRSDDGNIYNNNNMNSSMMGSERTRDLPPVEETISAGEHKPDSYYHQTAAGKGQGMSTPPSSPPGGEDAPSSGGPVRLLSSLVRRISGGMRGSSTGSNRSGGLEEISVYSSNNTAADGNVVAKHYPESKFEDYY